MPSAKRQIVWSQDAEEDLFGIWDYLSSKASRVVADRQARAIRSACRRLELLPLSGRDRRDLIPGIRSVLSDPYIVFYRVRDNDVEIIRVLHGRQDIEAIFVTRRRS